MPPCRVERATLLGVVQQQIVIVQCPLLQGLPVQISLLISPAWMMAVKVSNQDCRMRKDWWQYSIETMYLVPFMRYSASKNGVTLKLGVGSFKVIIDIKVN